MTTKSPRGDTMHSFAAVAPILYRYIDSNARKQAALTTVLQSNIGDTPPAARDDKTKNTRLYD